MKRRPVAVMAAAVLPAALLVALAPASAQAATTVSLDPTAVSLTGSGYYGHSVFAASNVRVTTTVPTTGSDQSVAAEVAEGTFATGATLAATAATPPTLTATNNDTTDTEVVPQVVLAVDFDGDGLTDGTLVGYPTGASADWSLTPDSLQFVKSGAPHDDPGNPGSEWHGTLAEWSGAFAGAVVERAGYEVDGAPSDHTIMSMGVAGTTYTFTSTAPSTQAVYYPDLDQSIASVSAGATAAFDNLGLEVTTPDVGGSVTEYFAPDHTTLPLAEAGQPTLRSGGSPGKPALHMRVDFNGDGTFDAVLSPSTSGPADNWYVGSTAPAFVQHRAPSCNIDAAGCVTPSNQTSGTSQWNGTLAAWAAAFPDAQIQSVGFTAASAVNGFYVVYSLTAGTTTWAYTNSPPVAYPNPAVETSTYPDPVAVDLTSLVTDADPADTLSFGSTDGRVSFNGTASTLTFTPEKVGTAIVSYTFHDISPDGNANHSDQTATIQFEVAKAPSATTFSVSPRKPTSQQKAAVTVDVTSDGSVEAGQVQVTTGAITRTANVTDGTAHVTLPRLSAGKHAVTATFLGTGTADTSSRTKTLTVVAPPRSASATTLAFRPGRPTTRQVPTAVVSVSSDGVVAGGTVRVRLGGTVKTATVRNGVARVRLHRFRLGAHKAVATFLGTSRVAPSTGRATLHVVRATRSAST